MTSTSALAIREADTGAVRTRPSAFVHSDRPTPRVESLDGLRTVAILFVVLYHLHVPYFTGGFIGVNVFYALSGYLITSILLRERASTGRIRLGRFWLRRVLRLYPALLGVVIAAGCLWFLVGDYKGANVDGWTAALLSVTYSANFARWIWHRSMGVLSQTWSLAMEEQFYLVWPPLLVLLYRVRASRTAVLWVLGAVVVASSIGGWLLYVQPAGSATPDVYFSPVLNLAPLVCGVILAILLTDERARRAFAGRLGAWCTWGGAVAVVAIEVAIPSGWESSAVTFGVVLPISGVVSTLFIAGLVCRSSLVAAALTISPISWFGRNGSYALYLWHVLVIALVLPLLPGVAGILAALTAAVLVAIGSHFVIERPFARVKRRLEPTGARERDTPRE